MAFIHIARARPIHQALVDYAALGWHVYPLMGVSATGGDEFSDGKPRCECWQGEECATPGKHPAVDHSGKTLAHSASCTVRKLLPAFFALDPRWEEDGPPFNIGLQTGATSNVVVWDIDPRNGGDDRQRELEAAHGAFPVTPQVLTGGGGRHFYFRYDARLSGDRRTEKFPNQGVGIDFFRGALAPIVMPPSRHRSLRTYKWVLDRAPWEVPLAACPEWIVLEVAERDRLRADRKARTAAARSQRDPIASGHPSAFDAYLEAHTPHYPEHRGPCPICGSLSGFTLASYSPLHWTCFSTRHADLRVGFEVEGAWSGDIIDIHAHRTGIYDANDRRRSRVALLKAMGCL